MNNSQCVLDIVRETFFPDFKQKNQKTATKPKQVYISIETIVEPDPQPYSIKMPIVQVILISVFGFLLCGFGIFIFSDCCKFGRKRSRRSEAAESPVFSKEDVVTDMETKA